MSDTHPQPPPGRTGRKRLVVAVSAVAAAALLVFGGLFLATRFLEPAQLASWLEPKIEAALGRDVSIASARVDLFPPVAVALEGVEVASPPSFTGAPFASVAELRLDLSVLGLLRRRVSIDEIRMDAPQIDVVVKPDGTTNAQGLGGEAGPSAPAGGQGDQPVEVLIESLRIDDGSISYRNEGDGSGVVVSPLRARFRVRSRESGGYAIDGVAVTRLGARSGGPSAARLGPYPVRIDASGVASTDLRSLSLEGSTLEVEDVVLSLAASLTRPEGASGQATAQLAGTALEVPRLLSLLPDSLAGQVEAADGRVSLDLRYAASLASDDPPELSGTVTVNDASVSRPSGPLVSALNGDVHVSLDSVWTTNLEAVIAGGPARVRGLLRMGEEGGYVARIAAKPDLSQAAALTTMPDSVTLSGGLTVDVTARGRPSDPASLRLSGRLLPEAAQATLPGVGEPIRFPQGTVLLEGDLVRWRDLPVLLGDEQFTSSGQLTDVVAWARRDGTLPSLQGSFRGSHFDVDAVFPGPPPDSTVLFGKLVFARLGERPIGGRAPREILESRGVQRPDSLPLVGSVDFDFQTLRSAPHVLSDVRGRVEFQPRLVRIHDVEAVAYGGRINADVNLGLGEESSDQPFSLALSLDSVNAGEFLAATSPLGKVFEGSLTMNLDVSGDLDDVFLPTRASVLGSGDFVLRGGRIHAGAVTDALAEFVSIPELRDVPLSDWSAPVLLRDGRVVFQESRLLGAVGEPRLAGAIGFGGQLALDLLFDMPTERLDSATLTRLGVPNDVFRRVQSSGQPLEAAVGVAGTVIEPLLSADQSGITQRIAEAAQDEAEAQVQEEIDERRQELEDRAADAVNRFLGGNDSVASDSTEVRPPGLNDLRRLLAPGLRPAAPGPPSDTTAADSIPADTTGTVGRRP